MLTVIIALGSFVLYLAAYHTYGRFLARRIFRIEPERVAPSHELSDGVDFVPSRRELVFGHHFTSIAGTGPIVGPAVAVVWGWVPALLWVLLGSIFMGAVHDFGSLIISMRHRGRTIADLSSDVISARVRVLFLLVVLIGLWMVLAIFGLVIAGVFAMFPSSIVPVFFQIPIAIALGVSLRRGGSLILGSLIALILMYGSIAWSGSIDWATALNPDGVCILPTAWSEHISPVGVWTIVLLVYVAIASILPVQWLLQPRDYINSHQLLVAMGLLALGLIASHPPVVADAINLHPQPASSGGRVPSFMPFLFVTIACGAISGFHCLVASGCSSRQLSSESDAQYVGYGAMLTEGMLAILVILACAAGIGMGTLGSNQTLLTGDAAWAHHYATWGGDRGLADVLAPFIRGSANMIETLGISPALATAIMGVFVASFAATTLDSATRLQRYIIAELAASSRPRHQLGKLGRAISNRYGATMLAVISAGMLAFSDAIARNPRTGEFNGLASAGRGGLILWPVFGAINQLLGGLALLVITVWLAKSRRPTLCTAIPMTFMLAMTAWAIVELLRTFAIAGEGLTPQWHLAAVAAIMLVLQIWISFEGIRLLFNSRDNAAGPPSLD